MLSTWDVARYQGGLSAAFWRSLSDIDLLMHFGLQLAPFGTMLVPGNFPNNLSNHADGVGIVLRQVFGGTGDTGMEFGATEFFSRRYFACCSF